jgi:hypothetical protein
MNKKITTIDDLAVMIKASFRMINKHFDRIDVILDGLEAESGNVREEI